MRTKIQSSAITEEILIEHAASGDLDAFNQLVLNYQDMAYSQAYALMGDPDSASDATQEAFIKAFQAINGFRGGSFRGWLFKIVTNSVYDILRRARRHPNQPLFPEDEHGEEIESAPWLVEPSASVQDEVEQREFSSDLYKMLDELPATYRSVITLIDINEMDYAEAAEVLSVPIGTIKSRLARARLQLQKKLRAGFAYFEKADTAMAASLRNLCSAC